MIATASAFALHFAHHTFASGFSQALVGVKLVPGELDHTKFFLATQDFFRLDHRQSFWPKHRPKLLPEPTQRSRALTSHCTLLRNLLRTVTRLQVTAHCCVKLLRTVTRLQVTAQTAA